MAKDDNERTPQEWREILRGFQYPEEVHTGRRRERRRAKKVHRENTRRRTMEWIKAERRREPIRPAGALIIVALILALGAGARLLWPDLVGDSSHDRVTASATPTPSAQNNPPADTHSSAPTPSPSSSSAADLSDPDNVAKEAIRRYLTRNPPADGDHEASVLRAAPYMTPALVENLASHSDPAFDKLVSRGGVATVRTVNVSPADTKLPADSPLRVWRKTTAKVHVEGYTTYTDTTELQVELVTSSGDEWHVSRILGL